MPAATGVEAAFLVGVATQELFTLSGRQCRKLIGYLLTGIAQSCAGLRFSALSTLTYVIIKVTQLNSIPKND